MSEARYTFYRGSAPVAGNRILTVNLVAPDPWELANGKLLKDAVFEAGPLWGDAFGGAPVKTSTIVRGWPSD